MSQFVKILVTSLTILISGALAKDLMDSLAFVVLSSPDEFHSKIAKETRLSLRNELDNQNYHHTRIIAVPGDLKFHGSWTIFPVISELINKLKLISTEWFVFLNYDSRVNINVLVDLLKAHDKDHFIGYALEDLSHTIIHHFANPEELKYPNFEAGFILSGGIVNELAISMAEFGHRLDWLPSDFSIDAQFEFAKALKTRKDNLELVHDSRICHYSDTTEKCAIYSKEELKTPCNTTEDSVIELAKQTLFAVKTCSKFHDERLPIIKDTWAKSALNVMYFSEVNDEDAGTIQLKGVTNTERGHCYKTMAIIKYFHEVQAKKNWKWLVIADDDTILSVQKMLEFLHCFDSEEPLHIGQRYGFNIATGQHGYDYVTGGGGMVFSHEVVRRIVENINLCSCKSKDAPDDMHLGICMSNLGLDIVHSSRFHQARPEDYSEALLKNQDPISFHKFWNTDPIKIYNHWFQDSDKNLKMFKYNQENPHQEL